MKKLIFAALTLALAVGCASADKGAKDEAAAQQAAAPKQTKVVTKSTKAVGKQVSQTEKFTSEIKAYQSNAILPAASGVRIDKIYFEVGDQVKKGDLVATLDPTQYNQQLINLSNLKLDYERLLDVYKAGGVSRQAIDQTKAALDIQTEATENMKKNIELRSPISGVVTARSGEEGDLFANQPILNIAQIDSVKVNVQLSEQFFTSVKNNAKVVLTSEIYPDRTFNGYVSLIYPALDPQSRTFTVEVTVPNKSLALRPGMHAYSTFSLGSKAGILVPDVAVQRQIGTADSYVYVIENGVAKRRLVKKGKTYNGDQIDILSGVEVGDEVVITAFSRIDDGTEVTVE